MINPQRHWLQVYLNAAARTEEALRIIETLAANSRPDRESSLFRASKKLAAGAQLRTELRTAIRKFKTADQEEFFQHIGGRERI